MKIQNVHELPIGTTKVFVIEGEKNILVDTGSGPLHPEVLEFMEQSGVNLGDEDLKKVMRQGAFSTIMDFLNRENIRLHTIICTHHHGDHTGNLKRLKEALKASAALHPGDIPVVEGREKLPLPASVPEEIQKHIAIEPCSVERALRDGEYITSQVQIIHVPGHTTGSICLLVDNRILIAGDCLVGKNDINPMMGQNELNPPVEMFSMDYPLAVKSLQGLLSYNFDIILPSHGQSILTEGRQKLETMLQNMELSQ